MWYWQLFDIPRWTGPLTFGSQHSVRSRMMPSLPLWDQSPSFQGFFTRSMKSKQQNDKLPINIVTAGKATGAVAVGTYTTGGAALGALIGVIVGTVGSPASIAVGLYTESLV